MVRFTSKTAKLTLLGIFLAILPATWVLADGYWDLVSKTEGKYEVKGATTLDVATAKALFDRGVQFVDVRFEEDWKMGHIPSAVNLFANTVFKEAELSKIVSKDQDVVIYCFDSG
jgi:3-mercaptopyruvate sulfurtransferase SseA